MNEQIKENRKLTKEIANSVETSSLPELHTGHTPVHKKVQAAAAYLMEGGNVKRAAKVSGVHPNSIFNWKKLPWWHSLIQRLKSDFEEDFKARLHQVAGKAIDVVEDRLENGDVIMNYKTGEFEHKPVQGKDAATMFGILWDKTRVMDNLPTSISENKSTDERLLELHERFEKMARQQEAKVVNEQ